MKYQDSCCVNYKNNVPYSSFDYQFPLIKNGDKISYFKIKNVAINLTNQQSPTDYPVLIKSSLNGSNDKTILTFNNATTAGAAEEIGFMQGLNLLFRVGQNPSSQTFTFYISGASSNNFNFAGGISIQIEFYSDSD